MCKSWCEMIVAIVVLVFALWETVVSQWVLIIAGIVLLIHSLSCKTCFPVKQQVKSSRRR